MPHVCGTSSTYVSRYASVCGCVVVHVRSSPAGPLLHNTHTPAAPPPTYGHTHVQACISTRLTRTHIRMHVRLATYTMWRVYHECITILPCTRRFIEVMPIYGAFAAGSRLCPFKIHSGLSGSGALASADSVAASRALLRVHLHPPPTHPHMAVVYALAHTHTRAHIRTHTRLPCDEDFDGTRSFMHVSRSNSHIYHR